VLLLEALEEIYAFTGNHLKSSLAIMAQYAGHLWTVKYFDLGHLSGLCIFKNGVIEISRAEEGICMCL